MNRKTKIAEQGYNITITGRHDYSVDDAMKDYILEKVSKVERFTDGILEVAVIIEDKPEHKVVMVMRSTHFKIKVTGRAGANFSSKSRDNMYAAIDKAANRLQAQVCKYKTKMKDHQAKGLPAIDMSVDVISAPPEDVDEVNEAIEAESMKREVNEYTPHVIKKKTRLLKTLTIDEAVMKMELSQDSFLIFRDEADLKIRVLYRRRDHNYGLIEPNSF